MKPGELYQAGNLTEAISAALDDGWGPSNPTYGDALELVYIFESKGEHLLGNIDTQYKKKVLDLMTDQHRGKKTKRYQQKELPFAAINEKAEFYLLEENKEEETVKNLFR